MIRLKQLNCKLMNIHTCRNNNLYLIVKNTRQEPFNNYCHPILLEYGELKVKYNYLNNTLFLFMSIGYQ